MAKDEKIIITKYHGNCVASFSGRCLQKFCEKYDKTCQGTNKKCLFYQETGMTREQVINIILNSYKGKTREKVAESILNALLDKGIKYEEEKKQ